MADSKITALTAISTVDPTADPLVIVDVSDTSMAASGTTKKSTINQLLGAGGTATLASATISGDLTAARLIVTGGTIPTNGLWLPTTNTLEFAANSLAQYRIAPLGVFSWYDGAGGTRMTLNATGLGVGVAPTTDCKLTVRGGSIFDRGASGGSSQLLLSLGASSGGNFGQISNTGTRWALGFGSTLTTVGTEALIWDSSGQVGIGVVPSASHILSCAGPIGISGTNSGTRTSYISNSGVCSIYYTDGGGSGFFTDFGNLIIQPRTSAARSVVIATGSTTPVERAVVKSTGQVRFVPLAADPAGAESGDVYYNSVSNKLKCYNGTTWNDLF